MFVKWNPKNHYFIFLFPAFFLIRVRKTALLSGFWGRAYAAVTAQAKLKQEEQKQQTAVNTTKVWLNNFSRGKLTVKQLTREVLEELINKIYVYPDQKIDIYFKFASENNSVDVTIQKDGVM